MVAQVEGNDARNATSDVTLGHSAPAAVGALAVFQAISAAAGIIAALKSILEDHSGINEQLEEILEELQELQQQCIQATADILEAIDGIHRDINQQTARNSITDADVARFNDLIVFDDKQEAMQNSFRGANRFVQENEAVFATAFMYVVNIRLGVLKEFDPNYFCIQQFVEEFQRYGRRLTGWIDELNRLIAELAHRRRGRADRHHARRHRNRPGPGGPTPPQRHRRPFAPWTARRHVAGHVQPAPR